MEKLNNLFVVGTYIIKCDEIMFCYPIQLYENIISFRSCKISYMTEKVINKIKIQKLASTIIILVITNAYYVFMSNYQIGENYKLL